MRGMNELVRDESKGRMIGRAGQKPELATCSSKTQSPGAERGKGTNGLPSCQMTRPKIKGEKF